MQPAGATLGLRHPSAVNTSTGLTLKRGRGAGYLYKAASQGHHSARLALARAYLLARGFENPNQQQALLWFNDLMEREGQLAIETLRHLLIDEDAFADIDIELETFSGE